MKRLAVSDNKRFLMYEDKTPFFWLADTAWEIFHRLDLNQAEEYFKVRAEQSFNVIQAVVLSEFDGLRAPNANGDTPLLKDEKGEYSPELLNEAYFVHIDNIIKLAEKYGIYVALVPTWGDKWNIKWGKGPEIFTPENARVFGKLLGERYKDFDNIVWVMGGDRPIEEPHHLPIIREMAEGVKEGGSTHIMTFHPMGGKSSSEWVHDETWLDFNMIQSGHSNHITKSHEMIEEDYNKTPIKPVVEGECNYEDHIISFRPENGYFDDTDVRRASYYAVFAGSLGVTYGHHSVWSMIKDEDEVENNPKNDVPYYFLMSMEQALSRPGANQMKHLKNLIESVDFFSRKPAQERLAVNYEGALHQVATEGDGYLMVYCPWGLPCRIASLPDNYTAQFMNPKTGEFSPARKTGDNTFARTVRGRAEDYVLVITY